VTVLAIPARSATGGSLVEDFLARRSGGLHTAVQYASVDDPVMSRAILGFELVFAPIGHEADTVAAPLDGAAEEDFAAGGSPVVAAIELLAGVLGLPVKDVLIGAKVRKRTYQYWKQHPETRPRVDSQGELWAFAQNVEILRERLGPELPAWMAQPRRRELLRRGRHDDLVQLVTTPSDLDKELVRRENARAVGFGEPGEIDTRSAEPAMRGPAPTRARTASRGRRPEAR